MLLLVGIAFTHCNQEEVPVTEFQFGDEAGGSTTFTNDSPVAQDAKVAFKNTVYTMTRQYCINCHTSQVPQHASADVDHAMSELIDNFKVNFDNIPASRIVAKIRDENHGCWSDCSADADEMEAMVVEWNKAIEAAKLANVDDNPVVKDVADDVKEVCTTKNVTVPGDGSVGAFTGTFYPITRANCVACHSGGGPGPTDHASAVAQTAHDELLGDGSGIFIDFLNPGTSGIVLKVQGGHNCGGDANCALIASQMVAAITQWQNLTQPTNKTVTSCTYSGGGIIASGQAIADGEVAPSVNGGEFVANQASLSGNFVLVGDYIEAPNNGENLAPNDVGGGVAAFTFNIDNAGEYEILAEINAPSGGDNSFHVQMDAGNSNPFRFPANNGFALIKVSEGNNDNNDVFTKFNLTAGSHTVNFRQREDGTQLKKIIIQPVGATTGASSTVELTFDLFPLTGIVGNEIRMVFKVLDDFSYEASSVRMINGTGVYVKDLKIYINGLYNPQHSTFTLVDKLITTNDELITPYSMLLLKDKGEFEDAIGIKFGDISVQN